MIEIGGENAERSSTARSRGSCDELLSIVYVAKEGDRLQSYWLNSIGGSLGLAEEHRSVVAVQASQSLKAGKLPVADGERKVDDS